MKSQLRKAGFGKAFSAKANVKIQHRMKTSSICISSLVIVGIECEIKMAFGSNKMNSQSDMWMLVGDILPTRRLYDLLPSTASTRTGHPHCYGSNCIPQWAIRRDLYSCVKLKIFWTISWITHWSSQNQLRQHTSLDTDNDHIPLSNEGIILYDKAGFLTDSK